MTDKPAAFSAVYSDWKLIKTRACVQIVLEVPLEASGQAYDALGGMPNAGAEVWCAVARLASPEAAKSPPSAMQALYGPKATQRQTFHGLAPSQQAGILCNEESFQRFLRMHGYLNAHTPETAAQIVREHCDVTSRSEIGRDNTKWRDLVSNYRAWMREPAVTG